MKSAPLNMDNIIKDIKDVSVDNTDVDAKKNVVNDVHPAPSGVQHVHTTAFVDTEGAVGEEFTSDYFTSVVPTIDQSMRDFLAKPYLVYSNVWSTGDVANTNLQSFSVATALLANSFWTNKLEGFNLYRGTAVCKVQINANPFQQGKLLLYFLPVSTQVQLIDPGYTANHETLLTSKRMLPCVELDATETVCTLKMPYVAPTQWYERNGIQYDWGNFALCVLAPLKVGSGGTTSVEYSIYLYFEDFELGAPIVPQSINRKRNGKRKYKAKVIKMVNSTQAEIEVSQSGKPISSILNKTADIADSLSSIPIIEDFAKPVSWVSRSLAGVASAFGFSKPNVESVPSQIIHQYDRYGQNSDGLDPAMPMTMNHDACVEFSNRLSIREEDEMSLSYLKRVSTVVQTFTWNATDATGTAIINRSMSPSTMYFQNTRVVAGHTATYGVGPPIFYLSKYFETFRGSFDIVLKFVKTPFHSGRLLITWTPLTTVVTAPTNATSQLALRTIVDIREGNEIRLNLPFLFGYNYLPCTSSAGVLNVRVLNLLRAPETCSQNIDMLLYMCGGLDFEFAIPTFFKNTTVGMPFSPQSGSRETCLDCIVDEGIGGGKIEELKVNPSYESMSEHLHTTRQLMKRYNKVYLGTPDLNYFGLFPHTFGMQRLASGTGNIEHGCLYGDFFSVLAPCFLFQKGGFNIKVIPRKDNDFRAIATVIPATAVSQIFATTNQWDNTTSTPSSNTYGPGLGMCCPDDVNGQFTLSVPYQCRFAQSFVRPVYTANTAYTASSADPRLALEFASAEGMFATATYMRSIREDLHLGYFIGCPPILLSYV